MEPRPGLEKLARRVQSLHEENIAQSESEGVNPPIGGDVEAAVRSQYRNEVAEPLHGFAGYLRQFLTGVASVRVQAIDAVCANDPNYRFVPVVV